MSDILAVETVRIDIISEKGSQGLPGVPGAQGKSSLMEHTTSAAVIACRAVMLDNAGQVRHATNTDLTHVGRVIGVAMVSAPGQGVCVIKNFDQIGQPDWQWILNRPIFLGVDGVLTQSVPGAGAAFLMVVGFPLTASSMFVSLREPIIISA